MTRVRLGQPPRRTSCSGRRTRTDIDPTARRRHPAHRAGRGRRSPGVPILVGAVMQGPGPDERQTTALWWDPARGVAGAATTSATWCRSASGSRSAPSCCRWCRSWREVGAQSVPGTEPGVLDVQVGGRPLKVGDVICFELAYDRTVYAALRGGRPGADGAEQQRHLRRHRPDRAAVRHHPGPGHGVPPGDRGRHHQQRVRLHRPQRPRRPPHRTSSPPPAWW